MGLSRSSVAVLMDEAARRPFQGSILTLGIMTVSITEAEVQSLAAERGLTLTSVVEDTDVVPDGAEISGARLFRLLGFDEVHATDISDYEGAEIIFDLNAPNVPPDHVAQYDMVLDSGTLEHLCLNIFSMYQTPFLTSWRSRSLAGGYCTSLHHRTISTMDSICSRQPCSGTSIPRMVRP